LIFVTTSDFSSESQTYATEYNIQLWDGKRLKEEFKLKLGRIPTDTNEDILIETMMPLRISYATASQFEVINGRALTSIETILLLKPYYRVECTIETRKFFKTFLTGGYFIMDGISGELITVKP
jgi:Restriction endonuclease